MRYSAFSLVAAVLLTLDLAVCRGPEREAGIALEKGMILQEMGRHFEEFSLSIYNPPPLVVCP